MQIFDSHTHLNDTPYAGHEAEFVQQAADLDVKKWPSSVQIPT